MTKDQGNPVKNGPIRVRIVTGDALTRPADLVFLGSGKKLLGRIEAESGKGFVDLAYPEWLRMKCGRRLRAIKRTKFLEAPKFVWKHVVSFSARPSKTLRSRFQFELLESMVVTVRLGVRPRKVVFVPYHRLPTETVVLNMLCLIYCMMRASFGESSFFRPHEVEIVDVENAEIFRVIGEEACATGRLKAFVRSQVCKYWFMSEGGVDFDPPSFIFESC